MTVESDAADAANATIRLPADVWGLLQESYDTRQRILDWMLAIAAVSVAVWAFWAPLQAYLNRGVTDSKPNMDVDAALPDIFAQPVPSRVYTWNLPGMLRTSVRNPNTPSGTRPPKDPSCPPQFA